MIWAFCCIFLVPKSFETAYFLNDDEKTLMRQRAHRTQAYSDSEGSGHYGKADIKEAAKDIKSWVHGVIQIAVVTILYGFGTFLPIIIRNGFNFSTKQVTLVVHGLRHNTNMSRRNTSSFPSTSGEQSSTLLAPTYRIAIRHGFYH